MRSYLAVDLAEIPVVAAKRREFMISTVAQQPPWWPSRRGVCGDAPQPRGQARHGHAPWPSGFAPGGH